MTLSPDMSFTDSVSFATAQIFRHFPIVDPESTELRGVLSLKDIAREVSKGHGDTSGYWLMDFLRSKMSSGEKVTASEEEGVEKKT